MKNTFSLLIFILILGFSTNVFSATITLSPSGGDDANQIQTALNSMVSGDIIQLNGDFIIKKTVYLPSNIRWILNGSLTLGANGSWDQVGWVEGVINAKKLTGITEKVGGATNIDMSGGTYYGNALAYPTTGIRFLNFVKLTDSNFQDIIIDGGSDDLFTLGPGCHGNECRNIIGKKAGASLSQSGNALNDKGHHNKWYDCIAEDCFSDGWTPKCQYSEFYRCIGRNNIGPGWGIYCRTDGSPSNNDIGIAFEGNKFIDCEAYGNVSSGFSFNISANSGAGAKIINNFIQVKSFNNDECGVRFRNKVVGTLIDNNEIDILSYNNKGINSTGIVSSLNGGLGTEADAGAPVARIFGSIVSYGNGGKDINTGQATNCTITAYRPNNEGAPVIKQGASSNIITVINFDCTNTLSKWCQQKYCGVMSTVSVTGISLNPSTATIYFGNAQQLITAVTPTNTTNPTVIWTTSNANVATVSRIGLVTAVAEGTTIITATTQDGGNTASSLITVVRTAFDYLDTCDVLTGWNSAATLNSSDQKQGTGCLEFTGTSSTEFSKAFTTPYNSGATAANGQVKFWYYVSDVTKIGTVRVEISSGGAADVNEYQWSVTGLSDGWNLITLNVSTASKIGSPDLTAINWFRIYDNNKTGIITTRVDAIQVGTASTLGINDVHLSNNNSKLVKIYPNPLKNNIMSIDLTGFEDQNNVTITISNLLGQTVYQKKIDTTTHFEINTSEILKKSIYLVSVESDGSKITQKLIVQ